MKLYALLCVTLLISPFKSLASHMLDIPWEIQNSDIHALQQSLNAMTENDLTSLSKSMESIEDSDIKNFVCNLSTRKMQFIDEPIPNNSIPWPNYATKPKYKGIINIKRPEDIPLHIENLLKNPENNSHKIIRLSKLLPTIDSQRITLARLAIALKHRRMHEIVERTWNINDPKLIYEYISLLRKHQDYKKCATLLSTINTKSYNKEDKNRLWNLTSKIIKEIDYHQKENLYDLAYAISLNPEYLMESHWLSGWISLQKGNNIIALKHFSLAYNYSKTEISKSKNAFWAGVTSEKLDNKDLSKHWLTISSQSSENFYAHLSMLLLDPQTILTIPSDRKLIYSFNDYLSLQDNKNAKLMYVATLLKNKTLAQELFINATNATDSNGEINLLTTLAIQNDILNLQKDNINKVNKQNSLLLPTIISHSPTQINLSNIIDPAIPLAIMKRESQFNPDASSNAGARGFMQIMPSTASEIAKKINMPYENEEQLYTPNQNLILGTHYIKYLLHRYDNCLPLALAAYNAGLGNVDKWIKKIGDPRKLSTIEEIATWIERIPFHETKHYVVRVLENTQNYRSLLSSQNKQHYKIMQMKYDLFGHHSDID